MKAQVPDTVKKRGEKMMVIEAQHIVKEFVQNKKQKGISGAFKALLQPEKTILRAVDDISFSIQKGEIVGYLGPNGAGKSTTVKILTGILQPTSGSVYINGLPVHKHRKQIAADIGVVFGQRSQLFWDLRLGESFELLRRIYCVEKAAYTRNMELMHEVLAIGDLINIPVRQLSLGQRMRGDIAAAMLHSPSILFLDEPTIGLDVAAKDSIRKYIRTINSQAGVSVILTTHDLDDVESLCSRIMVINHGRLIEDGTLDELISKIAPYRYIVLELDIASEQIFHPMAQVIEHNGKTVTLRIDKSHTSAAKVISDLSASYPVRDISVQETKIEDIIRILYQKEGSNL